MIPYRYKESLGAFQGGIYIEIIQRVHIYAKVSTFFMDASYHILNWKGGFVLMFTLVSFLVIYLGVFHFFPIPIGWYTYGMIFYFMILRANKNLKTSLFSIFNIFQKFEIRNILEYLCAFIFTSYIYWRRDTPLRIDYFVALLTISSCFYLCLFHNIIGSPKFSLKKIFAKEEMQNEY